jgi:hypothetical protein
MLCHTGEWERVRALHDHLQKLLERYYPMPFPQHDTSRTSLDSAMINAYGYCVAVAIGGRAAAPPDTIQARFNAAEFVRFGQAHRGHADGQKNAY